MLHFYTSRKRQKTSGFLGFSGDLEMEQWLKMAKKQALLLLFPYEFCEISQELSFQHIHQRNVQDYPEW